MLCGALCGVLCGVLCGALCSVVCGVGGAYIPISLITTFKPGQSPLRIIIITWQREHVIGLGSGLGFGLEFRGTVEKGH